MEPLAVGQVWSYNARPGEAGSRLTICRIETHPALGRIVHIHLTGLRLRSPGAPGGYTDTVAHMPYAAADLQRCLVAVVGRADALPDFESGYDEWRTAFDAGKGGVWTLPLREAMDGMDAALGDLPEGGDDDEDDVEEEDDGPAFDPEAVIAAVRQTVGDPPRRWWNSRLARRYATPARPTWARPPDLTHRIYDDYQKTVRNGRVRWAAIVHANNTLFEPGLSDSGAQIVYAVNADVPLEAVRAIAGRAYALKETKPADPARRRLADMLTDEMERALDWEVPPSVTGGPAAFTTVCMLPRTLMPEGFLCLPYFPVLADPASKMAVLVPSEYWPAALRDAWLARARVVLSAEPRESAVTLTPAAAAAFRSIAAEERMADPHLFVWLEPDPAGGFNYKLDARDGRPDPREYQVARSRGVAVAVGRKSKVYIEGTVLDHRDGGFAFDNPNAQ